MDTNKQTPKHHEKQSIYINRYKPVLETANGKGPDGLEGLKTGGDWTELDWNWIEIGLDIGGDWTGLNTEGDWVVDGCTNILDRLLGLDGLDGRPTGLEGLNPGSLVNISPGWTLLPSMMNELSTSLKNKF